MPRPDLHCQLRTADLTSPFATDAPMNHPIFETYVETRHLIRHPGAVASRRGILFI